MSDTELIDLECGSRMSQWPYGDDILSMGDICKQLGTEASIEATSIEVSVYRTLPEEARRLQVSPIPYEIPRWYST
jgi:5-enolpyruvylshikimate-3-phosphate synthase